MNENNVTPSPESNPTSELWNSALRLGMFRSFRHFRGLLIQGEELSQDDRDGLVDLLNLTEEYMGLTWPEAPEGQEVQQ